MSRHRSERGQCDHQALRHPILTGRKSPREVFIWQFRHLFLRLNMVISMARNEKTSSKVATLAAKGLKDPGSLTKAQIKTISGSVLTQAPDKPKRRK